MYKKIVAILVAFILTFNLAGCGSKKKTRYTAQFLELFNTASEIVAYAESKDDFARFSQLIYDNLKEYHELYDIYNDYEGINNIKTINDNAGIKPVKVDKRIIDLLLYAKKWYEKTDGRINVAFGAVLKIWHKYRTEGSEDEENAVLPPMDMLKEASRHTDINKMVIDEANSTVFLEDKEMSLDVGAIAKGYAVEQVTQIAIKNGFTSGLISVGGNLRAIGNKEIDNKLWNVGIQNPDKESKNKNLEVVYLENMSLVTSGDYERYYIVDGKRYHHIIDPDTLFPAEYFTAVTIICEDSGMADALSTSLFNMPLEKGKAFINSLPEAEALWVLKNGEIVYSNNFKKFTSE